MAQGHWARFDDLVAGAGLRFGEPFRRLVARHPDEVAPVLAEVDRATRQGCWAYGYVGYEAAPGLDPRLTVRAGAGDLAGAGPPLAWFGLAPQPLACPPVAPPASPPAAGPPTGGCTVSPIIRPGRYTVRPWRPGWTPAGYRLAVAHVRGRIAAGDTYQCNLTVRLRSQVHGDLTGFYADLALNQRARYAAYLDLGGHVVASASPELFFQWEGDRLLTRPMKGTTARGRTSAEDAQRLGVLLGSAKERAENIIVVDLLRNDLSRIARAGSVQVPALCAAERYETVWQLTSDVAGEVPGDTALVEVFRALFPSGSVTGAPKPRTMEIIRDLEDGPRGVYCGAIGWVAPPHADVRARFSVAIRTAVVDRGSGRAVYGTGGGITWDSDAEAEHVELQAKAVILAAPYEAFDLLETMALLPGTGLRHLDRHLDRLADSAAYFGFAFDRPRCRASVAAAERGPAPARVVLRLHRSGRVRVELGPAPAPARSPVRLVLDPDPVDRRQRWLYHHTTRRQAYTTRAARHPEADEVVVVNDLGQVTETTAANLGVRIGGIWCTPPVSAGCLPGVERGRLVETGRLHERELTPQDLRRADALAVVSSLRGRRPAVLAACAAHRPQPDCGGNASRDESS